MKSVMKIFTRYVLSAAGVALILLVLNLTVFFIWAGQTGRITNREYRISEIADSLSRQNGKFVLSEFGEEAIGAQYQWAMLLNDSGTVIWSENLPEDVKPSYTVPEVASFSRWYLNDYPVFVWKHPDGLLVLGSPKGSVWKQKMEMPEVIMENLPAWLIGAFIANCIAAVLLALLFGTRLLRSLRPIAKGIEDMAEKQPVKLSTGGLLGELAAKLNQTSSQLQIQGAALQKRDNARTTWIAGVSHDIRTPLSIVMGYASQLEDNSDLPLSGREQAHIIRKQSEKIKTLVSDLNLASKLEYDMQPLRQSTFHPAALVRTVVADFLNNRPDARYPIEINVKDNLQRLVMTGDEELIRRALSNLIENSIRHNPDGCRITVNVEKSLSGCEISVLDNGTGFPSAVLENLNNVDDPVHLQNHGLGLTIVRQIMKAHNGTAAFKNFPEGGCSVVLCFP